MSHFITGRKYVHFIYWSKKCPSIICPSKKRPGAIIVSHWLNSSIVCLFKREHFYMQKERFHRTGPWGFWRLWWSVGHHRCGRCCRRWVSWRRRVSGDLNGVMNRNGAGGARFFDFDYGRFLAGRQRGKGVRFQIGCLAAVMRHVVELLEAGPLCRARRWVDGVVDEVKDQFVDLKCWTIL